LSVAGSAHPSARSSSASWRGRSTTSPTLCREMSTPFSRC